MTDKADNDKAPAPATNAIPPEESDAGKKGVPNTVWMGTAVGIGSAALVAALMYAKRRK